MSKKKQIETVSDIRSGILEAEIIRIIEKVTRDNLLGLAAEDVKIIAQELMPDLDRMISRKVKTHIYEIGVFLTERFNTDGE
jgi:hypothetical protein